MDLLQERVILLPSTKQEPYDELKSLVIDKDLGDAGNEAVIDQYLRDNEISIICFCDAYKIKRFLSKSDGKQAEAGNMGPDSTYKDDLEHFLLVLIEL